MLAASDSTLQNLWRWSSRFELTAAQESLRLQSGWSLNNETNKSRAHYPRQGGAWSEKMLEKKILKSKRKWISRLLNLYASTSRRATISRIPRQPAPQTPNLIFTRYDGLTHKWLDILYLLWQRPDYAKATYLTFRKLVSSYPLKVRKFRYLYSTFTKMSDSVAL